MKRLNLKAIAGWLTRMWKYDYEYILTIGNEKERNYYCEWFVKHHYCDLNERQIKQISQYILNKSF